MDKMNIMSILLFSFPEGFCNILTGLFIIGEFRYIPLRKLCDDEDFRANILKLILSSIFTTIVTVTTRRFINDMIVISLINIFISIPIIRYFYFSEHLRKLYNTTKDITAMHACRIKEPKKMQKSFYIVLSFVIVLALSEFIFMTVFFEITKNTLPMFYENDMNRLTLFIFDRLFQAVVILLAYKFNKTKKIVRNRVNPAISNVLIFLIAIVLIALSSIVFYLYNTLTIGLKVLLIIVFIGFWLIVYFGLLLYNSSVLNVYKEGE